MLIGDSTITITEQQLADAVAKILPAEDGGSMQGARHMAGMVWAGIVGTECTDADYVAVGLCAGGTVFRDMAGALYWGDGGGMKPLTE